MKYSIVIATYNRAADLRQTLRNLAALTPDGPWEVIVVNNNSSDETRAVVDEASRSFPVELRYLFERQQGRSPALNAGIRAARGDIIATTDDDVQGAGGLVEPRCRGAAAARLRLRRRSSAADLGCAATRLAPESRRQILGGDRASRLRDRADRVQFPRTAGREHGVHA